MAEKKEKYGLYFMKGAFFFQLKEVDNNLLAIPTTSKGTYEVDVVFGEFDDLESALKSGRAKVINIKIGKDDFDYMVLAQGETSIYYINTSKGLERCDLELYVRDSE